MYRGEIASDKSNMHKIVSAMMCECLFSFLFIEGSSELISMTWVTVEMRP